MKAERIFKTLIIVLIMGSNIGCDQVSKSIARQHISYHEEITVIKDFLTLTKVENPGAFLSLGHGLPAPVRILVLSILPALVLTIALFYVLTKTNLSNSSSIGICFVVGGGVGNIYDRIVHGSVTDFLHMDFVLFETGIFNMADVSIMVGMLIVVLDAVITRKTLNGNPAE
jgi:signal peptidase II